MRLEVIMIVAMLLLGCSSEGDRDQAASGDLMRDGQIKHSGVELKMEDAAYETLRISRDSALGSGRIQEEHRGWVEAQWCFDGKEMPVKLRLKGDEVDHVDSDQWSLRVAGVGAYKFMLSIQHPKVRGYFREWMFRELLVKMGLPAPDYGFIKVKVNGNEHLYAIEQHHADSSLLASWDGVLKFEDRGFWAMRDLEDSLGQRIDLFIPAFEAAAIKLYGGASEQMSGQLDAYRWGEVPASEVFDAHALGTYLAVCDLVEAYHALVWFNWRFASKDGRLHPLAYDGFDAQGVYKWFAGNYLGGYSEDTTVWYSAQDYFVFNLLNDPEVRKVYSEQLFRMADRQFLEKWVNEITPRMKVTYDTLSTYHPDLYYNIHDLFNRADSLKRWMHQSRGTHHRYEPYIIYWKNHQDDANIPLWTYPQEPINYVGLVATARREVVSFHGRPLQIIGYENAEEEHTRDTLEIPGYVTGRPQVVHLPEQAAAVYYKALGSRQVRYLKMPE